MQGEGATAPPEPLDGITEAVAGSLGEATEIERALFDIMEQLRGCPPEARHAELVAWARSPWWHPALMIARDWHGALAREAYRALRRDLDADTPGRRWNGLNPTVGRASIVRLLGLTNNEGAYYASMPFRAWIDDDDRHWIAGAVGCQPMLDPAAALAWTHLDIRDVILWCPKSGDMRLAGEHASVSAFVLPSQPEPRLTIWGDGGAFFRAWAARRAHTVELARQKARGEWAHPVLEPTDGNLPGGLVIGCAADARWPAPPVEEVAAAEGVTAGELHFSAIRHARLPQFGSA